MKYIVLFPLSLVALLLAFVVLPLGLLWHFNTDRAVGWFAWWLDHTFEPICNELYPKNQNP